MDARVVTEGPARSAARGRLPRLVRVGDDPVPSEHFSRAVYLWQNNFDPQLVIDERPAVVIQEWVGRRPIRRPRTTRSPPAGPFSSSAAVRR